MVCVDNLYHLVASETLYARLQLRSKGKVSESNSDLTKSLVVRKMDNAIHRIHRYPVGSLVCLVNTYPLDRD